MKRIVSKAIDRQGITLSEVLVAAVIAGICVALLLPALLSARENARQRTCERRLTGLILAAMNYESGMGVFPAGVLNPTGPIVNEPVGRHHNWISQLLPFLDHQALFDQIDPAVSIYAEQHAAVRATQLFELKCPTAPTQGFGSNYAGCHSDVETAIDLENTGIFFLNRPMAVADVLDGLKHTLFLGEKIVPKDDLGWYSGTRATLRNTGRPPESPQQEAARSDGERTADDAKLYVGGFGSWHVDNSHFAMGNGSVSYTSHRIDATVYQQLGNRADGSRQPPLAESEP